MTDAASHAPANCENCATPLQGKYCHACGQSIHNPLRNFGHALEELVESFWHLDGRVFRTLRDLLVPPPSKMDLGTIGWDADKDPIRVGWLPDFANRWLTAEAAQGKHNLSRIQQDPELFMRAFFGAMPKALFMLVPLFALLLKLAYVRSGRPYLEHLVVALYSHSWLLLIILLMCLLSLADDWLAQRAAWATAATGWLGGLLWLSMPAYLLLMQKRVYGQGWLKTLLKYFALGSVYFFLVTIAVLALAVYSVIHA